MDQNVNIHALVEKLYASTEWNFNCDTQTIKLLFMSADDETKTMYGGAFIAIAGLYRSSEMIKILNINVNIANSTTDASTGLMISAANNNIDAVKFLIKAGSDVNYKNMNDDMALHIAIFMGNFEVVQLLIKAGADIDIRDKNFFSPLDCALVGFFHHTKESFFENRNPSYINIVETLISSGANIKSTDQNKKTVIDELLVSEKQLGELLKDSSIETLSAHKQNHLRHGIQETINMLQKFKTVLNITDSSMDLPA